MGFRLQIQADYGNEALRNLHPDKRYGSGKAILAFLTGLSGYAHEITNPDYKPTDPIDTWFQELEWLSELTFMPTCSSLLGAMWADGGDPTEFQEHEYKFYLQRVGQGALPEDEFKVMVRGYPNHWQPIQAVREGVQLLLQMFSTPQIKPLEGFFDVEYTPPDFEALELNLKFLQERGNTVVRLNFN